MSRLLALVGMLVCGVIGARAATAQGASAGDPPSPPAEANPSSVCRYSGSGIPSRQMIETRERISSIHEEMTRRLKDVKPADADRIVREVMKDWSPPPAHDVMKREVRIGGLRAAWLVPPNARNDVRLLFLHGGGFQWGSIESDQELAAEIARAAGAAALMVDYRLAPADRFPAALEDSVTTYQWMRAHGPDGESEAADAFIVGGSAGGGLALSTAVALRDRHLPLPAAMATFSAWTDLAGTGASSLSRAQVDILTPAEGYRNDPGRPYLGTAAAENPLASPLYANPAGLPPMIMQVGDREVLLDDTVRFAEKAADASVPVVCEVELEAHHVYQFAYFGIHTPEGDDAVRRAGAFLRAHTAAKR